MNAKRGGKGSKAEGAVGIPFGNKKRAVDALELMLLVRRFEERAGQLYGQGLIGGFCHLYIGQEAVIAGVKTAIEDGDTIITSYRDHGAILAVGTDPKAVMAELTGRVGGVSKGKGGSMHMFDVARNFYGGHGIVGSQVSLGTGLAMEMKMSGKKNVSVVLFGEGALNQGQVYESLNMASLWKLPVLYLLENNRYAMGTSLERATGRTDLHEVGAGLGITGRSIDGQDVEEVERAVSAAVAKIRAGEGPQLIEARTYRYRGHSMSDPATYRTRDEVKKMREEHDPIDKFRERLLRAGVIDEKAFKGIETKVKAAVQESVDFAVSSPEPGAEELTTDVVVE